MNKDFPELIIISPHLDDAVLSCGGMISKARSLGFRCMILTFFSGGPSPSYKPSEVCIMYVAEDVGCNPADVTSELCIRLAEERREEDRIACSILEVDRLCLNYPDAIFRGSEFPFYCDEGSLFNRVHVFDEPLITELQLDIGKLGLDKNAIWFIPYGIGNHVDHQLTKRVFDGLRLIGRRVYYAEIPYFSKSLLSSDGRAFHELDISSTYDKKLQSIYLYKSQLHGLFGGVENVRERLPAFEYYAYSFKGNLPELSTIMCNLRRGLG